MLHCCVCVVLSAIASERAGAEGERLKEGASINRSLVCLGTVISALGNAVLVLVTQMIIIYHVAQLMQPTRSEKEEEEEEEGLKGSSLTVTLC